MKQPGIAEIVEPALEDFRSTVVTQVWHARDLLSLAQRQAEDDQGGKPHIAATQLRDALAHLRSAQGLMSEADGGPIAARVATIMFPRTITATEAAIGHIDHYRSYIYQCEDEDERKRMRKLKSIWRRSAEEAKKESHRLLTRLCDVFPDAYDREGR